MLLELVRQYDNALAVYDAVLAQVTAAVDALRKRLTPAGATATVGTVLGQPVKGDPVVDLGPAATDATGSSATDAAAATTTTAAAATAAAVAPSAPEWTPGRRSVPRGAVSRAFSADAFGHAPASLAAALVDDSGASTSAREWRRAAAEQLREWLELLHRVIFMCACVHLEQGKKELAQQGQSWAIDTVSGARGVRWRRADLVASGGKLAGCTPRMPQSMIMPSACAPSSWWLRNALSKALSRLRARNVRASRTTSAGCPGPSLQARSAGASWPPRRLRASARHWTTSRRSCQIC